MRTTSFVKRRERKRISSIMFGIVVLVVVALLGSGVHPAHAATIAHNGTLDSSPPGTGEVNVRLTDVSLPGAPFFFQAKTFFENATHKQTFGTSISPIQAIDIVSNQTPLAWSGFSIDLMGADWLADDFTPAPEINPVDPTGTDPTKILGFFPGGGNTLASSLIVRDGENASLSLFFDNPIDPNESFSLSGGFAISSPPGTFDVAQRPSPVPEPSTVLLLSTGVMGLAAWRWRKSKTSKN